MAKTQQLIKSKKRVRKFAEVFTPEWIVKDMCSLIPKDVLENIETTILEPSCGNGNFLIEILSRKLKLCTSQEQAETALNSITGIDIQSDNCAESRERMKQILTDHGFKITKNVVKILDKNIICGDSLKIMERWIEENA